MDNRTYLLNMHKFTESNTYDYTSDDLDLLNAALESLLDEESTVDDVKNYSDIIHNNFLPDGRNTIDSLTRF